MSQTLKELIVVLVIALAVFKLARRIALLFTTPEDYARRRNTWLALTIVAFLSPSIWIFAAVAAPLLLFAGRKDSNPAALYLLLLHVIPPFDVRVPMIGISFLFDANIYLLLSFCVMTPAAWRLFRSKDEARARGLDAMDICLFAYGALCAFLFLRPETASGVIMTATFTDDLRRIFLFFFLTVVPYYAISRGSSDRRQILDMMATYCLACGILAAIALFESSRHWLMYADMPERWGVQYNFTQYLERGSSLRAMASSGHPLALGYLLVIGLGFWLYLQSHVKSKRSKLAVTLLFWLGLLAAYSRGPWIAAACAYFFYAALRPRVFSGIFKAAAVAAILAALVSVSPLRDKIVDVMPFLGGTVDSANVDYRHRLLDRSWEIIRENPLLGDQGALLRMQDLRQGQGIIDIVNGYLGILLSNGFVGLSLILCFILVGLFKAWGFSKENAKADPDLSMLGANLVACIMVTLLLLTDGSLGTGCERMFYVLAGLAAAYAHLRRPQPQESTRRTHIFEGAKKWQ